MPSDKWYVKFLYIYFYFIFDNNVVQKVKCIKEDKYT